MTEYEHVDVDADIHSKAEGFNRLSINAVARKC